MSEIEENQLCSNLSGQRKNMKYIDVYLHLKTNLQNNNKNNCQCNSKEKFYCIPCKLTCCSLCSLKQHQEHILINMEEYYLNIDNINKIFNNYFKNIKKSKLMCDTNELRQNIMNYIDKTVDEINSKLDTFRKKQKEEIAKIFKTLETNKNNLKENIDIFHIQLNDYVNNNKKFFNLNNNKENNNHDNNLYLNNDFNNMYFLQGYDLIILTNQDINKIYKIIDTLEEDLQIYLTNQKETFSDIKSEIDKLIQVDNIKEGNNKNHNKTLDLNKPMDHFLYTTEDLGLEHFENVKDRINKYNKHIKNFKKELFKTIKRAGNLKEI